MKGDANLHYVYMFFTVFLYCLGRCSYYEYIQNSMTGGGGQKVPLTNNWFYLWFFQLRREIFCEKIFDETRTGKDTVTPATFIKIIFDCNFSHLFEPTCVYAQWALMHHFLYGCDWTKSQTGPKVTVIHISKSIAPSLLGSQNLVRAWTGTTPRLTLRVRVIGQRSRSPGQKTLF